MTVRRVVPFVFAALAFLLAAPRVAHAQTKERAALKEGLELYDKGEYVDALHKLQEVKEGVVLMDAPEQVTLHKYRAYCYIVLQKDAEAKSEFDEALKIDPTFDLDPAQTPPKILAVFREVKEKYAPVTPRHAMTLSLLPGLGQWKTQRHGAAAVAAGAVIASIGVFAFTQANASTADHYASIAGPNQKSKFRAQATEYGLVRDAGALLVVGAWVGNMLDARAGAIRLEKERNALKPVAVEVVPVVSDRGAGFLIAGRF